MSETPLRLNVLLKRLVEADIRFVLVGGLAVGAWGYVRGTKDLDVVPVNGLSVRVCSLGHLLQMKRASERLRDRDDLEALEAAQPDDEIPEG